MLIICNGVFKSGSTWLHAIILEILKINKIKLTDVPSKYTNNIDSPTTIVESKLLKFLDNENVFVTSTSAGEVKLWASLECIPLGTLNSKDWKPEKIDSYITKT